MPHCPAGLDDAGWGFHQRPFAVSSAGLPFKICVICVEFFQTGRVAGLAGPVSNSNAPRSECPSARRIALVDPDYLR